MASDLGLCALAFLPQPNNRFKAAKITKQLVITFFGIINPNAVQELQIADWTEISPFVLWAYFGPFGIDTNVH